MNLALIYAEGYRFTFTDDDPEMCWRLNGNPISALPNFFDPETGLIHCHRLEGKLTTDAEQDRYLVALMRSTGNSKDAWHIVHATAPQRARALYETLCK